MGLAFVYLRVLRAFVVEIWDAQEGPLALQRGSLARHSLMTGSALH
jgi:hypothetical protein